jgi:hypothetical protein
VKYLFYGLAVEIAQHVGIAGTAGFDITARIDMQAAPRRGTIGFIHILIYDCWYHLPKLNRMPVACSIVAMFV